MPSTTSSSVLRLFASSTVITPSLPTFFIASARKRPISLSPLAEIVAICAISSFEVSFFVFFLSSSTTASTARSMPRLRSIGFMPAATAFAPSRTIACARTVAVVVPSPAWSDVFDATSRTICAPMFSNLSSSSISFATVTPSLVMRGAPNDLSSTTLRPFGPSVTFTALARISTPRSMRSRASSANFTSFAVISKYSVGSCFILILRSRAQRVVSKDEVRDSTPSSFETAAVRPPQDEEKGSGNHAHDVGLLHDQEFLAVELDLGARPFPEQHTVAGLHVDFDQLAALVASAGTDGDDLAFLRLLLGGVGNDDAAVGRRVGNDAAQEHAVMQRAEFGLGHVFLVGASARAGI